MRCASSADTATRSLVQWQRSLDEGTPPPPRYFAVDTVDARGRIRKTYPIEQIMTPWQRLQSIPDFARYLKPGAPHDPSATSPCP